MYAQLGTKVFDPLKSFVSFSDEEEAVLVEHALINRKPQLQGSGISLRTLSLSLYLHQSFANVQQDVTDLRTFMRAYEILPLLWGNGQLEGKFVIASISRQINEQDGLGNIYACTLTLSLKEVAEESSQKLEVKQQEAKKNATAVGNKKPAVKSNRVNQTSCNQQIANTVRAIKSNAMNVDVVARSYSGSGMQKTRITNHANMAIQSADKLITAADNPSSCAHGVPNFKISALNVKTRAGFIKESVATGATPDRVKRDNDLFQRAVSQLQTAANPITTKAITRK